MVDNTCYVHFNNPICYYGYFICTASPENICPPIQALTLNEWAYQAFKRGSGCHYKGAVLTFKEADTREMNEKKANKIKYLMR
jgi:hypothetical protein